MGEIMGFQCEKCGFGFCAYLGVGMAGHDIIRPRDVNKWLLHEYGKEIKEVLEKHNNQFPYIDDTNGVYECRKCHNLFEEETGDVHYFEDGEGFGMYEDFSNHKPAFTKDHFCPDCGRKMRKRNINNMLKQLYQGKLKCPCCGEYVSQTMMGCWD